MGRGLVGILWLDQNWIRLEILVLWILRVLHLIKTRIVREADACKGYGDGLYSSQLVAWRKLYNKLGECGFTDTKHGRKPTKNPLQPELDRTQKKLAQAELIIDFQKTCARFLE